MQAVDCGVLADLLPGCVIRMASRNAGKYTEDGRFDEKRTSQFPAFERAILNYATQCLDEWRDKAIETANSLVRTC